MYFRTMILGLFLLASACASQSTIPPALQRTTSIPGGTLLNIAAALRQDALANFAAFSKQKYACDSPAILDTTSEAVEGPLHLDARGALHSGYIKEQWSVDVCGSKKDLTLLFGPDGKGGNYVGIGEKK